MRKILQIAATILVLAASLSTASFADGGNPIPLCPQINPIASWDSSVLISGQVRCMFPSQAMHRTLQDLLWITTPLVELATLAIMFWRGIWREYPVFWSYLVSEVARAALLFSIGNEKAHYPAYFWAYWITEFLICMLGFFVVAEVFDTAFSERLGLRQWGKSVFWLTLLFLVVFALFTANNAHGSESSKLVAGIVVLKRAESLVRLGLIAGLAGFVFLLGLPWRNHTVGIALGLGFYGAVELLVLVIRVHYGPAANQIAMWALMIAALSENVTWAAYFFPRSLSQFHSTPNFALDQSSAASVGIEGAQEAVEILLER